MNDSRNMDYLETPKPTTVTPKAAVGAAKATAKYKKAPGAPRRFKSAFIFFSTEKHKEIRQGLGLDGAKEKTTNVAKMVSEAWKGLVPEDREIWEQKALRDKERYLVEKQTYSGPWKVAAAKRSPKDPNAPKRPMSAFLSFSNSKRALVKRENPTVTNAEASRLLSRMWRDAPEEVRQMHIDTEFKLRQKYKSAMGKWRENAETEKTNARLAREDIALKTIELHKKQAMEGDSVRIVRQREIESAALGGLSHPSTLFHEHHGSERGTRGRGTNFYDHAYENYEHGQQESQNSAAYAGLQHSLNETNSLSMYQSGLSGASASMPNIMDRSLLSSLQHQQNISAMQWFQRDHLSSQPSNLGYGGSHGAGTPSSTIPDAPLNAYSGYQSNHGVNPYIGGHRYSAYDQQQQYDGDHSRVDDNIRSLFNGHYQG